MMQTTGMPVPMRHAYMHICTYAHGSRCQLFYLPPPVYTDVTIVLQKHHATYYVLHPICMQVPALIASIRQRMLTQYCAPYSAVGMASMALAFGVSMRCGIPNNLFNDTCMADLIPILYPIPAVLQSCSTICMCLTCMCCCVPRTWNPCMPSCLAEYLWDYDWQSLPSTCIAFTSCVHACSVLEKDLACLIMDGHVAGRIDAGAQVRAAACMCQVPELTMQP